MIKVKIEVDDTPHNLELPTSWEEVTVEQFALMNGIVKEGKTDLQHSIEVLCVLLNLDVEIIYMLPIENFNELIEGIEFIKSPIEDAEVESIMVGDEEYYLKKDFNQLTMGETISVEFLLEKGGGNILSQLPEMLCIFLRKKKENGNLETFKNSFMKRAEQFKHISIVEVNRLFVFFSNGGI